MATSDLERFFLQRQIPHVKPFYAINKKDDSEILEWIKETDIKLRAHYDPLFREQKNNLKSFLNMGMNPNFFSPMVATYIQQGLVNDMSDDVNVNELFRVVMDQVSLTVSNELVPQVIPNNDDYRDKVASKITKQWLESMSYDLDIDIQRIKWEIQKKVFGECFVVPMWDAERGDLLPDSKKYLNEELPLVDETGREVFDALGKPQKIKKHVRQGDIDLVNPMPFEVMLDPRIRYEDCNWFYWVDWVDTDYLKMKYKKINFKDNPQSTKFDGMSMSQKGTPNHIKVFNFFHKSHEFMPEGRHIVCTEDHVLINKTLEDNSSLIETQTLPLVRFIDLDMGIGCRGIPILFRNLRSVVSGYNRLTNQIYKNLEMESPKIFAHESSGIDAQRMPNGILVMEWRGAHKPSIETPSTNTTSIFKFREDLKNNIIEMGMQMPTGRGQTPNAQLDSFIALQHFEDQRVQLAAPDIKGHIKAIEHLYRRMISLARDHYDPDDGRLIKIIGKNNKFCLKFFNPENLDRDYDVKITTTGNLANSKAARTQLIMTLKREFPNILQDEVFIDMLGLSSAEKFQNAITAAVNSAEAENEDMSAGEAVIPPERYEDLITHWDAHRIPMQSQEFKLSPQTVRDLFERHMTATEKLMFEVMAESPTFTQRVQALRQFPMFFTPSPVNEPFQLGMQPPQGAEQELGGDPQNGSVPTDEETMEPPPLPEEQPPEASQDQTAPPPTPTQNSPY